LVGPEKQPNRLGQVVEIEGIWVEDPLELGRRLAGYDRGRPVIRLLGAWSRLAVSHGRVLLDTHNEFRLAVTALSGGECC